MTTKPSNTVSERNSAISLAAAQSLLGLGSYAVLVGAGRTLPSGEFALFTLFWSLAFSLGLGLVVPLEQLIARAIGSRRQGARAVVARLTRWYSAATVTSGLIAAAWLSAEAGGGTSLAVAPVTFAYFVVLLVLARQRGILAGEQRLSGYAAQLAADGGTRFLLAVVAAVAVLHSTAGWMGILLVAGCVAVLAALPRARSTQEADDRQPAAADPVENWRHTAADVASLTAVVTVSLMLANSVPTVASASGATNDQLAALGALIVLARIPLFFVGLVTPLLIPRFAVLEPMETARYRSMVRALLAMCVPGVLLLLLATGLLVGPAVAVLFGPDFATSAGEHWLAALSTAGLVLGLVLQTVLTATGQMVRGGAAWLGSAGLFAVVALLPLNVGPVEQTLLASAVSGVASCTGILLLVWHGRPAASRSVPAGVLMEYD